MKKWERERRKRERERERERKKERKGSKSRATYMLHRQAVSHKQSWTHAGKVAKTQAYLVASTMQIYAQQLLSTHSCKQAVTKNAGKSHTRMKINKCAFKVSTQSATIMNNTEIYKRRGVSACVCVGVCVCVCVCVFECARMCVCIDVYVCMCVGVGVVCLCEQLLMIIKRKKTKTCGEK